MHEVKNPEILEECVTPHHLTMPGDRTTGAALLDTKVQELDLNGQNVLLNLKNWSSPEVYINEGKGRANSHCDARVTCLSDMRQGVLAGRQPDQAHPDTNG